MHCTSLSTSNLGIAGVPTEIRPAADGCGCIEQGFWVITDGWYTFL